MKTSHCYCCFVFGFFILNIYLLGEFFFFNKIKLVLEAQIVYLQKVSFKMYNKELYSQTVMFYL